MRKTLEKLEFRVSYNESLALCSAEGPPVLEVYIFY
jgi:hypothetical protein